MATSSLRYRLFFWAALLVLVDVARALEIETLDDQAADTQAELDAALSAGRRGRSPPSAGGSFSLFGSSNRAGNDEEQDELGEDRAAMLDKIASSCGEQGVCSKDELYQIWRHAWNKGYASSGKGCERAASDGANSSALARPTPAVLPIVEPMGGGPSWGCGQNEIYISQWLIQDEHAGCFLVFDRFKNQHDMGKFALNRDFDAFGHGSRWRSQASASEKDNTVFWKYPCSAVRRLLSFALFEGNLCGVDSTKLQKCKRNDDYGTIPRLCDTKPEATGKPVLNCLKKRDQDRSSKAFELPASFSWDVVQTEKCGKFIQNHMLGPPWFRYSIDSPVSYAAELKIEGAPFSQCYNTPKDQDVGYKQIEGMLDLLTKHISGKCVNRDMMFPTAGKVSSPSIPGLCLDSQGNCQCYDGKQMQKLISIQYIWAFYAIATQFVATISTVDTLACYDAPHFNCILQPWKWEAEANERNINKRRHGQTVKVSLVEMADEEGWKWQDLKNKIFDKLSENTKQAFRKEIDWCQRTYAATEENRELGDSIANSHISTLARLGERWGAVKKAASSIKTIAKKATKTVASKVKSGATELAKKAIRAAVKKYLPEALQDFVIQVLVEGKGIAGELKLLFGRSQFKKWVIGMIKPRLQKAGATSVGKLLDLWCHGSTCVNRLNPTSVYGFVKSKAFLDDWRRPYSGIAAFAMKSLQKLTNTNRESMMKNAFTKFCGAFNTLSGKWDGYSTLPYEKAPLSYLTIDIEPILKKFEARANAGAGKLSVYLVQALPKFWRRAASAQQAKFQSSVKSKDGLQYNMAKLYKPEFSCMSGYHRGQEASLLKPLVPKPGVEPKDRTIRWGCPDAIPKYINGKATWVSSGQNADMVSELHNDPAFGPAVEPLKEPLNQGDIICEDDGKGKCGREMGIRCVIKLDIGLSFCDTCCCKEGIMNSNMESSLVYGHKNECAAYFAGADSSIRMYTSVVRLAGLIFSSKDVCMDPKQILLSNQEVCQRFKCNGEKLSSFSTSSGSDGKKVPSDDATLEALCHDTVCPKPANS